jgi:hypothetical protein
MIRGICVLAPFVALLLAACVDTTPIHVDETRNPVADSGTPLECSDCIMGEGQPCRPAYDLCLTLPDCPVFHQCVIERGCYGQALLEDRLACGQPCLDLINLSSTHPGLPGILALNDCTQEDCRAQCVTE